MLSLVHKHRDKITGTLFCADRLIFKGYLPICYPQGMENFFADKGILLKDLKDFGPWQAQRLRDHAERLNGGPIHFLAAKRARMTWLANSPVKKATQGLITLFSCLEICPSFRVAYGKDRPRLQSKRRRCLVLYFYYLDPAFGLLHVRLPTWFPFTVQVYVTGHEWLANALRHQHIDFQRRDNAFLALSDAAKAHQLADQLLRQKWPGFLNVLARRCIPLLGDLLKNLRYRWVIDQAEFALDLLEASMRPQQ